MKATAVVVAALHELAKAACAEGSPLRMHLKQEGHLRGLVDLYGQLDAKGRRH
jgi:hypothetical protein